MLANHRSGKSFFDRLIIEAHVGEGRLGSRSLFPRLASRLSEMRFAPGRKAVCSPCVPTAEKHASAKIASLKLTKPYPYGPGDTFDPTCASGPDEAGSGAIASE